MHAARMRSAHGALGCSLRCRVWCAHAWLARMHRQPPHPFAPPPSSPKRTPCPIPLNSMAMRILDIRSQLAKEFIQDLTDVTGARRGSRSDCQLEPK